MKLPVFTRTLSGANDKLIFLLALFGGGFLVIFIRSIGDATGSSGISIYDKLAVIIAVLIIFLYGFYIYYTKDRASVSIDRASDVLIISTLQHYFLLHTLVKLVGFNIEDDKSIGNVMGFQTLD